MVDEIVMSVKEGMVPGMQISVFVALRAVNFYQSLIPHQFGINFRQVTEICIKYDLAV